MQWARVHANDVARKLLVEAKETIRSFVENVLGKDRDPFLTRKRKHSEFYEFIMDKVDGVTNLLKLSKVLASHYFKVCQPRKSY